MNQTNLTELVTQLNNLEDEKGNPEMSPEFRRLVQEGLHHVHLPPSMHPKAAEALQVAFEGMGGLPRLLKWADDHPAQFYKLFARMVIPTITPVLPQPSQTREEWPEWLSHRRLAYQEAGFQPSSPVADDGMAGGDE